MKILLAGPFPKGTAERFKQELPEHEIALAETQEQYDSETDCGAAIVRVLKTTESTIKSKPKLKAILRWGAGYDSVDIAAAGRQGVLVANAPGINAYAVAELAVGLMIAAGRNIIPQDAMVKHGAWNNKPYTDRSASLNRKTVGIIGGGNIGQRVAKRVQAFGAGVVYYDPYRLSEEKERELEMKYLPLDELLEAADVVSLHVPLTDSTRHMIGREQLSKMKERAIIVNTARGGLIDDEALAEALKSGHIAAAGLDCVEDESFTTGPLEGVEGVVATPHIGGISNDLADEMIPFMAEQIRLLAKTGDLRCVVNREYLCTKERE